MANALRRRLRAIVLALTFAGSLGVAMAQSVPLVSQSFSMTAVGNGPAIVLNGQPTCSITVANAGAGLTLVPQVTSDSQANILSGAAQWSTATTINSGSISTYGNYVGNVAGIGLTGFRFAITALSSGTVSGSETCSGAVGLANSSGPTPAPYPTFPAPGPTDTNGIPLVHPTAIGTQDIACVPGGCPTPQPLPTDGSGYLNTDIQAWNVASSTTLGKVTVLAPYSAATAQAAVASSGILCEVWDNTTIDACRGSTSGVMDSQLTGPTGTAVGISANNEIKMQPSSLGNPQTINSSGSADAAWCSPGAATCAAVSGTAASGDGNGTASNLGYVGGFTLIFNGAGNGWDRVRTVSVSNNVSSNTGLLASAAYGQYNTTLPTPSPGSYGTMQLDQNLRVRLSPALYSVLSNTSVLQVKSGPGVLFGATSTGVQTQPLACYDNNSGDTSGNLLYTATLGTVGAGFTNWPSQGVQATLGISCQIPTAIVGTVNIFSH